MKRSHYLLLLLAGVLISCGLNQAHAVSEYNTIRVASGLNEPTFAVSPQGDKDRLFIVERKTAQIKVLSHGILQVTPFLDLGDIVGGSDDEQGLLGLAFHPNFLTNGFFYVSYTTSDNALHVVRYHTNPNSVVGNYNNPDIPWELFSLERCVPTNNGGALAFGSDGYLYIATGDGDYSGDPGNYAQNGQMLLGKVLRLDVNSTQPFAIPADNPFINNEDIRGEIWALGLHNPSGLSFDPYTGDLYLADVGQDNFEEINVQPAVVGGQNYGWTVFEGTFSTGRGELSRGAPVVTFPSYEYPHAYSTGWVLGGAVYRGLAIPEFQGSYFFTDKYSGQIYSLKYGPTIQPIVNRTADLLPTDNSEISQPACIASDALGELFVVDRKGGQVFKMVAGVPQMLFVMKEIDPATPSAKPPIIPQADEDPTATPLIVLPYQGGTLAFDAYITNLRSPQVQDPDIFDFWTDLKMPDQSVVSPVQLFLKNAVLPGQSTSWGPLQLTIPQSFPEGQYYFQGHAGRYPDEPWFNFQIHFAKAPGTAHTGSQGEVIPAVQAEVLPTRIELMNAFPNPFNPETVLRFALPQAAPVELTVFDISGRQVATLMNGLQEAGVHQVTFNGTNLPSGIYIYRFQSGGYTAVNKMTLIK